MSRMPDGFKLFKEYAKDYILKNTGLKILALLITAVLWLSVASRLGQVIFPSVPIEISDIPEGLTISDFDQAYAKVFLRGPKDVIDSLRLSDLAVLADLRGVEPGVRVIPLTIDLNRLPPSIDEQSIDIEPRNIRITVEPQMVKELEIVPRLAGVLPQGYEMYGWSLSRRTVAVQAAASHLTAVQQVSTETVNISDRTESFSQQVAIDTGSPNIATVEDNPKVMLTMTIGETRKERVFERLPVTLINAPAGVQSLTQTARVTLFGGHSLIDALTPEQVQIIADYQATDAASGELRAQVKLAVHGDKISVRSVEPQVIRVR